MGCAMSKMSVGWSATCEWTCTSTAEDAVCACLKVIQPFTCHPAGENEREGVVWVEIICMFRPNCPKFVQIVYE